VTAGVTAVVTREGAGVKGIVHPLTGALYERDGEVDGEVVLLVTDGDRSGRFRPDGRWISGELRECDPQLCGWVAGPQVPHHRIAEPDLDRG
jgi:hypothetical protein